MGERKAVAQRCSSSDDDSDAMHYMVKYAKIIENPGRIVLERIDLTASQAVAPEQPKAIDSTKKGMFLIAVINV